MRENDIPVQGVMPIALKKNCFGETPLMTRTIAFFRGGIAKV